MDDDLIAMKSDNTHITERLKELKNLINIYNSKVDDYEKQLLKAQKPVDTHINYIKRQFNIMESLDPNYDSKEDVDILAFDLESLKPKEFDEKKPHISPQLRTAVSGYNRLIETIPSILQNKKDIQSSMDYAYRQIEILSREEFNLKDTLKKINIKNRMDVLKEDENSEDFDKSLQSILANSADLPRSSSSNLLLTDEEIQYGTEVINRLGSELKLDFSHMMTDSDKNAKAVSLAALVENNIPKNLIKEEENMERKVLKVVLQKENSALDVQSEENINSRINEKLNHRKFIDDNVANTTFSKSSVYVTDDINNGINITNTNCTYDLKSRNPLDFLAFMQVTDKGKQYLGLFKILLNGDNLRSVRLPFYKMLINSSKFNIILDDVDDSLLSFNRNGDEQGIDIPSVKRETLNSIYLTTDNMVPFVCYKLLKVGTSTAIDMKTPVIKSTNRKDWVLLASDTNEKLLDIKTAIL